MLHKHADRTAHENRPKTGIRSLKRTRKPTLDGIVHRFGFTRADLADARISRLIHRKFELDETIAALMHAGYREERIAKFAELIGFTSKDLAGDSRIAWLIGAIFDSRRYLAGLQPSRA